MVRHRFTIIRSLSLANRLLGGGKLLSLLLLLFLSMQMVRAEKTVNENESERLYRKFYLESVLQKDKGNESAQFLLLKQALKYKPNAAESLAAFAGLLARNPYYDEDEVERIYGQAIRMSPENVQYRWEFAKYEIMVNQLDTAAVLLQSLTSEPTMRSNAYSLLANIYDNENQNEQLLETLNEWAGNDGEDEDMSLMRHKAYEKLGRYDDALKVVDSLCSAMPQSDYYPILKAETLLGKGDTVKALAQYKDVVATSPDNCYAQQFMIHYYQLTKGERQMTNEIERLILNPKQNMGARSAYLQSFIKTFDGTKSQGRLDSLWQKLLQQPMEEDDLMKIYTSYLSSKNAPDSAYAPIMTKLLEINPSDRQTRLREAWSLFQKKQYEKVVASCEAGIKYNPEEMLFYVIGGNSYTLLKQKDKALKLFEAGFPKVKNCKDKDVISDYFSAFGDLLHEAKRKAESYAMYDSSLVHNPNNVSTLNNYAYFLSLENDRMDEAEKMAALAVKYSPDEATYLDTYAWVLFVEKNYEQAKTFIEKALKNAKGDKTDNTLWEHAGDIYIKLGQTDKALEAWEQAVRMGSESKSIKQKIKQKKYIKE